MIEKGFYKHYKGNVYEVVGEAIHTETEERLVVYRPIVGDLSRIYVRPVNMWNDIVDGKKRFERIDY